MACTTILVGKKASYDGSTIIARNDDGNFTTKKMIMVERNQSTKYKSVISHLEIELPKKSYRYSCVPNVEKNEGIWGACGINEKNVAMTATETITSNPLVKGGDPLVEYKKEKSKEIPGGIGEEDLITITLPYISSARQGVERVGQLLEKYGTYESNGMAFADENEIWWLETIGGHHFIAVKIPDDVVVMAPNSFSLDFFDIEDAYGKKQNNICSKDLKQFIKDNHLNVNYNRKFNPRVIFGSHSDKDHECNSPRAWFMFKYFNKTKYDWINNPPYLPSSDNIPFSTIPERKVTIEDIKYLMSSHYQDTEFDPYRKNGSDKKYYCIGVPNSDDCGILQIRPYMPEKLKGIIWLTLGGAIFTACVPQYVNVDNFPTYLSKTSKEVSTDYLFWSSRILAALVDSQYHKSLSNAEKYISKVFNESYAIINKYDQLMLKNKDYSLCNKANEELAGMLKKATEDVLKTVLLEANLNMKTKYNRNGY